MCHLCQPSPAADFFFYHSWKNCISIKKKNIESNSTAFGLLLSALTELRRQWSKSSCCTATCPFQHASKQHVQKRSGNGLYNVCKPKVYSHRVLPHAIYTAHICMFNSETKTGCWKAEAHPAELTDHFLEVLSLLAECAVISFTYQVLSSMERQCVQIAELSGIFILVPIANGCHGDGFSDQSLRWLYIIIQKCTLDYW